MPAEIPIHVVATNCARLRRERQMTQAALAERAGLDQPRISELESGRGNPTLQTLEAIANACGVRVCDLLQNS